MNLVQVVHRLATDSTFANQLQDAQTAALLDQDSIEAVRAVFKGPQAWQELCNPGCTGIEGYWEAAADTTGEEDRYQARAYSFDQTLQALCPQRPMPERSLRALPALCCEALELPAQAAQQLSTAWNTLYSALHLLDNIEDGDQPDQVWAAWGTGPTLNFTTGLLAKVGLTLDHLADQGIAPEISRALQRDFNRTILSMCAGQHNDLTLLEPTLEQCWEIAEAKSGLFFALAGRAAATLAGVDAQRVEQFAEFGRHLGLLVQITDDLSGLWSWTRARSDLGNGQRWTLPVAYTMSALTPEDRARLQQLLSETGSPSAEDAARELIIASGAVLYLTTQAQRHYHAALRLLEQLSLPETTRAALLELLHLAAPKTINPTQIAALPTPEPQPTRPATHPFMLGRTSLFATTA